MRRIVLKIDVDTDRGTLEGVPRLARLLEQLDVRATFLFSLGPDQTGRALRRVFRRGFLGKVRRTSVVKHYGLRTLLYGTLLPGPHIGRRRGALLREVARSGFEVGVHTYNHAKWQDGVATASEQWTRHELTLARDQFTEIFSRPPWVHGAAGWQMNAHVPELERELGFRYASDTRGTGPFIPMINGSPIGIPQLPTTLPTLDELIGRSDLVDGDPIAHLLALTGDLVELDHVYTLHAELEGGIYLGAFERLLRAWRKRGLQICDLASYASSLDARELPHCELISGRVAGRSGRLAYQGEPARA